MKNIEKLMLSIIVLTIMLTGCVSQKEAMIKEGYPLAYADGFDDGCHSGKKAGGNMFEHFKKDVKRFGKHSEYAQGWSDGFRQCETEQEALDRSIRMSMEQQSLIETKKHNKWEENKHLLEGIDTSGLEGLK